MWYSVLKTLLFIYQATRCHILEVSNFHTNSSENNFTCSRWKQFVLPLCYCSNQTVRHVSGTMNWMAQSFLGNQQLLSQPKNPPHFIVCKVSWRFSQEYATCPYSKPDKSNSCHPVSFKIYFHSTFTNHFWISQEIAFI